MINFHKKYISHRGTSAHAGKNTHTYIYKHIYIYIYSGMRTISDQITTNELNLTRVTVSAAQLSTRKIYPKQKKNVKQQQQIQSKHMPCHCRLTATAAFCMRCHDNRQ